MKRREFATGLAGAVLLAGKASPPQLTAEAYIFQQYAQRQKKELGDVLVEAFQMTRDAGFRNIELNAEFFAPALRERTLRLVREQRLAMPSVYSGGVLHDEHGSGATMARVLEIAEWSKPFGCRAVVFNADPKKDGTQKSDAELAFQARALDRMGRALQRSGFELRVHNHTPEMKSGAREWRNNLTRTDPKLVSLCLDLDWVYQGDQSALGLLREAGRRVTEIHVRSARNKLWLEAFEPGDVDYTAIAQYLRGSGMRPLIGVELAYRPATVINHSLTEDLAASRRYAEQVFG